MLLRQTAAVESGVLTNHWVFLCHFYADDVVHLKVPSSAREWCSRQSGTGWEKNNPYCCKKIGMLPPAEN